MVVFRNICNRNLLFLILLTFYVRVSPSPKDKYICIWLLSFFCFMTRAYFFLAPWTSSQSIFLILKFQIHYFFIQNLFNFSCFLNFNCYLKFLLIVIILIAFGLYFFFACFSRVDKTLISRILDIYTSYNGFKVLRQVGNLQGTNFVQH